MSEEKKKKEYTSIKVPMETREKLVDMGVGITQAVQSLVTAKEKAVKERITDISEAGAEIANILLDSGVFNIKFEGSGITSVEEEGESIKLIGYIKIGIPDKDVRSQILDALKGVET